MAERQPESLPAQNRGGFEFVRRVSDIIAQVANVSETQNEGVRQVSIAIADIDQATQTSAAQAEELPLHASPCRALTGALHPLRPTQ